MKKKNKTKAKRKTPKFSRRTLFLRKFRRTLKLITRQRVYITFAVLALIIVASTAVYAINNPIDLITHKPKSSSETSKSTNSNNITSDKTDKNPSISTPNPEPASCYQINVAAETQFLKSTDMLIFPHYGDSKVVFDAYNNGYRQAYNNYISTVKTHNCPITIADKGTVQYGSPNCTQAYSDNLVVFLRNQINSSITLDMAEYKRWFIPGLPKTNQQIVAEQNYIQNKNNVRVRDYVNQINVSLTNIFCPSLNPDDFYTHMF